MKIFKKMKKGFTLVELVVVIAVIAILAAVSVGAYFGVTESANASRLEQETKQIHTAIQTVSLAGSEHSSLSNSGLEIKDRDLFEDKLIESLGKEVFLTNEENKKSGEMPTIYFSSAEYDGRVENGTYKTFHYYLPDIGNKKAVADVVTGECKIADAGDTTIADPDAGKVWYLVNDARSLKAGDEIVIAAKDHNYALSTTIKTNNIAAGEITKDGEFITVNDNIQTIKLENGSVEGTFAFNIGEKSYLYGGTAENHLKVQEEIDAKASWNIFISKGSASIVSQGTVEKNILKYNPNTSNNAPLFSCYASGQSEVSIYKFDFYQEFVCNHIFEETEPECLICGSENPNYVPYQPSEHTVTIEEALNVVEELGLEKDAVTSDYYIVSGTVLRTVGERYDTVYLTDGTNQIRVFESGSSYENLYDGYKATLRGLIKNYNGKSEIVDFEIVSVTPIKYTITIPTFENGSVTATLTSEIEWGTKVTLTVTPNEGYSVKKVLINNTEIELNNNAYKVTVDRNLTVSAEFVESASVPQTETATITFDDTAKRTQFSASIQVWEENGITVTNNKLNSTNSVADYAKPARFYKNSELIVAKDGMVEILFDCNTTSHATALKNAIGESATIVNSSNVRIEFDTAQNSFTVVLKYAQVQLDSITVKYTQLNTETHEHIFLEGKCSCGAEDPNYEPPTQEPESPTPSTPVETKYVFSSYATGTQYAENEVHELDENTKLVINKAHLNTQVRLYDGSNAVVESTNIITKVKLKAGYKVGVLNVYSSTDGITWNLINEQATTTTYTDYTFEIPNCKFIKMEGKNAQVRVSEMTLTTLK